MSPLPLPSSVTSRCIGHAGCKASEQSLQQEESGPCRGHRLLHPRSHRKLARGAQAAPPLQDSPPRATGANGLGSRCPMSLSAAAPGQVVTGRMPCPHPVPPAWSLLPVGWRGGSAWGWGQRHNPCECSCSPQAGESPLMRQQNKDHKGQGREHFEGAQGELAMGSLWLLKTGSSARSRHWVGDLGDAIWFHAHYSILVSTTGTRQGQAYGRAQLSQAEPAATAEPAEHPLAGVRRVSPSLGAPHRGLGQPELTAPPRWKRVHLTKVPTFPAQAEAPCICCLPKAELTRENFSRPKGELETPFFPSH